MEQEIKTFFVTGAVRSGTTLLRLLLGHHPAISRCEEMEFVAEYYRHNRKPIDVGAYAEFLQHDRGFRLSKYTINPLLNFEQLAKDFLQQQGLRSGDVNLISATVHNDFSVLPELYEDARYIYLRRDPREVAQSCVQMGWSGTAWHGVDFWLTAQQEWELLKQQVPESHRIEISFEDLIHSSQSVLQLLCQFLQIEYDPVMLDIEKDTTYTRPDPNQARSWRDFPEHTVRQVETRLGRDQLMQAGYQPSDYPPLSQGKLSVGFIAVADVLNRIQFRIKRYGLSLWIQGALSRRFAPLTLKRSVQMKIDAIDNNHMK